MVAVAQTRCRRPRSQRRRCGSPLLLVPGQTGQERRGRLLEEVPQWGREEGGVELGNRECLAAADADDDAYRAVVDLGNQAESAASLAPWASVAGGREDQGS